MILGEAIFLRPPSQIYKRRKSEERTQDSLTDFRNILRATKMCEFMNQYKPT